MSANSIQEPIQVFCLVLNSKPVNQRLSLIRFQVEIYFKHAHYTFPIHTLIVETQLSSSHQLSVPLSLSSYFNKSLFFTLIQCLTPNFIPPILISLPSFLRKLSFSSSHLDLSPFFRFLSCLCHSPTTSSSHLLSSHHQSQEEAQASCREHLMCSQ